MNIYVVTHPQATHHVDGLVGGWFDSDLTDLGRRDADAIAAELAQAIAGDPVDVVCSDLRRASRTARIIADRVGTEPRHDGDLREKSYGDAEGRPQSWLRERQIPLPAVGERLRHDEGIPGAETRWQLAERAYAAMRRIETSTAANTIVVTHGGTATLLLAAWIGMPIEASGRVRFDLTSGAITKLHLDERTHSHAIAYLNRTAHLTA
ncbi:histidine phosphatase family protein [Occultella gossypii]|uniref:Histidine phosphatase family protein n=1 Tax=Occultella gossypii TaxID=2800820 RepID=A0ABS7S9R5_9MICO|nr:histidine phosphatase family protein [Occultella gossypii]MBZ2197070.1 histidine phosphatase family protein [Occultella gossypii]